MEEPSVAKQRGAGSDVPGDAKKNPRNEVGWSRKIAREVQDGPACVSGLIEFDEKASADASHKKFSDKKLPESRAKKKNGRA